MDNLPTVIMEAMSAGLPVVSTRLAGIPEMIRNGSTGFLVDEHDITGLANSLRHLLGDLESANAMGLAAKHMALDLFDSSVTSFGLRDVFIRYGVI